MADTPIFIVEPVPTSTAMFALGYRFVVIGPQGKSWGHYRTEAEARRAAEALNVGPESSP